MRKTFGPISTEVFFLSKYPRLTFFTQRRIFLCGSIGVHRHKPTTKENMKRYSESTDDEIMLVTGVIDAKDPDAPLHCTLLFNGSPQFQQDIPRANGNTSSAGLKCAIEEIVSRLPKAISGWRLRNGLVCKKDGSMLGAACASGEDLLALVKGLPLNKPNPSAMAMAM